MKSKTKLFKDLEEINPEYFKGVNLDHPKIGDETYGPESYVYIMCQSSEDRSLVENKLERKGHIVSRDYAKGSPRTQVRVSYFKGRNWNI